MKACEKYGKNGKPFFPRMEDFICEIEEAYGVAFVSRKWFQGTPDGKRSAFLSAISYPENGGLELILRPLKEQNVKIYDDRGFPVRGKTEMEAGVDADIACELTKALMDSRYDVIVMITGDGDISRPFITAPPGVHAYVCGLKGTINENLNPYIKSLSDSDGRPVIDSDGKKVYLYVNYIFEKLGCIFEKIGYTPSGEDCDATEDFPVLANFRTRKV